MLLRFTVENSLSFNEEASISLIATSDKSHPHHVCIPQSSKRPSVLRAAAIYGANAHGKSKLVESVIALQRQIRGRAWRAAPFKLDPGASERPTRFIIEFRHEEFDYEYGTVIYPDHVAEEWLFTTNMDGREEKIFERATSKDEGGRFKTVISPGRRLSALKSPAEDIKMSMFLKVLATGLKPGASFMSESKERDFGPVSKAFAWMSDVLTPISATSAYTPLFERVSDEESFRLFIGEYMKHCDVGIENVDSVKVEIESDVLDKMPDSFRKQVAEIENSSSMDLGGADGSSMRIERDAEGRLFMLDLRSYRRSKSGELVKFNLDEESSGTRRLFDLLPMIANDGDGKVYVVDELDRKLHPLMAYEFLKSFLDSKSKQIIFTTHNTHLMSLDLLRRDEIWFIQKRQDGSSDLYALSDMKVRNDLNIRKGYISGRFGAIPFFGNMDDLGWVHEGGHECVSN